MWRNVCTPSGKDCKWSRQHTHWQCCGIEGVGFLETSWSKLTGVFLNRHCVSQLGYTYLTADGVTYNNLETLRQTKTDRTFECEVYLCFFHDVSRCSLKRLMASARKPRKTLSETSTTAPNAAFHKQHLQGCATFSDNWWFAVCLATLFISWSSHRRLKAGQSGIYSASSSVILTFALFDFFLGQHPPVASVTMSTLRLASNLLILAGGLTPSRWCVMWWRKEWLTSL